MNIRPKYFVLIFLSLSSSSGGSKEHSPIVQLRDGRIQGAEDVASSGKRFFSFQGIPYAKPPVGDLRFEAPVKPDPWEGTLQTTAMPAPCSQVSMMDFMKGNSHNILGKEDCLYLNVFTPQPLNPEAKLAVMVFIHGGGYISGGANEYNPHYLLNEDVLLVVIQYRLGVFGFLSTEDSTMAGNMGMKDQTMALEWVQENIESFGGDKDKVTIFGNSAGGASVHLHLFLPNSKGLFRGVIAESGFAVCSWSVNDQHRKFAEELGKNVGCCLHKGSEEFKNCMRRKSAAALLFNAAKSFQWGFSPFMMTPRVDGDFLPDRPEVLLRTGKYNKASLIAGVTRDDGAFMSLHTFSSPFMLAALKEEFDTYGPHSLMMMNETNAAQLSKLVYDFYLNGKSDIEDAKNEVTQMLTDGIFAICCDISGYFHSKDKDMTVYLYEFHYSGQRSFSNFFQVEGSQNWIPHIEELFYIFDGVYFTEPLDSKGDIDVSNLMVKLWTNFAKFGNPTPDESLDFAWKPANPLDLEYLKITSTPTMEKNSRKERIDFWMSLDTLQNRLLFPSRKDEL